MIRSLFKHKTKNITSAAIILLVATFLAKITGLLEYRVLINYVRVGRGLDIFFAAFKIPDFLFNILIIGSLSSALIPVFAEYWQNKSQKEAWNLFNNILWTFLAIIAILGFLLFIFTPQLMRVVVPGFKGEDMRMVVLLTRIMFLSPLILTISNIFGAALQYFSKFLVYSFAPILYNLGIIFGVLFFYPRMGLVGLAWGVILGAFLHLLIQIPAVFLSGFKLRPALNLKEKGLRKIVKLALPRTIGVAATQINTIVITAIASLLSVGSIAIFNLSNDLQFSLVSLFGLSFSIAAFPSLSKSFSQRKKEQYIKKFTSTFSQIIFFVMPLSCLFFILRAQIVRIIFGVSNFTWQDTRLTAACLGAFSLSIFAQSLIPLISQSFYARQNTKRPVQINVIFIFLNIILSFSLVWGFLHFKPLQVFFESLLKIEGVKGSAIIMLPVAFSVSAILNFIFLLYFFKKEVKNHWEFELRNSFLRIFLLSIICSIICFGLLYLFAPIFGLRTFFGVFMQAFLSGGASIVFYLYFAKKLKFPEYKLITSALFKKVSHHVVEVEVNL